MAEQNHSVLQKLRQGLSRTLMIVGAAGFWIGDKFLYEIKHVNFLTSEAVGIGGGILAILIGAAIANPIKSAKAERHDC